MAAAELSGGCICGATRYRLTRAPMLVGCCHCRSCQTETGSAFVVNALIEGDAVERITGVPDLVMTPSESGRGQEIARCPACHVAVWSHYATARRKLAFVRVGTLDAPALCPPDVHIFTRSKLPWVLLPEGVPAFDIVYDPATFWSDAVKARWAAAMA
jgi:hypothetical protein